MNYKLVKERCMDCGLCAAECHLERKQGKKADPERLDCTECGHCYCVCPSGAIIPSCDEPESAKPHGIGDISYDSLSGFLQKRRSHRLFEKKAIEREVLDKIFRSAVNVPSGGNRHGYEFTLVNDEQIKKSILEEIMAFYKRRGKLIETKMARMIFSPFVDRQTRSFLKSGEYSKRIRYMLEEFRGGKDMAFYGAPTAVVIHSKDFAPTPKEDAVLIGYNINLLAETLGLGGCFVTLVQYALNSSSKLKKMIGLTPNDQVYAVVLLGYPAGKYIRTPIRREKELSII